MTDDSKRDKALHARIDNLTSEEQEKMVTAIRQAKKSIAPEARGTIVEGDRKSLPSQDFKALEGDNE
ncbi:MULTISPECIES: hypothetical protein [Spirulina sp. CCY15215]|uniref:hypothetical protein n=1 Tax=Spirulina sp. CCY15215 TaxID=2767591 RepID=UPI0019502996|nr:hypothetical protein [Spirulina major]